MSTTPNYELQERDARTARAYEIRLGHIVEEMKDLEDRRREAIEIADACLVEFDELAKTRFALTRALWRVQQRLAAFDRQDRGVAA